jgi:hypothetical protein
MIPSKKVSEMYKHFFANTSLEVNMRTARQANSLRREIDDGLSDYRQQKNIAKCGTLTSWPYALPEGLSVRRPLISWSKDDDDEQLVEVGIG